MFCHKRKYSYFCNDILTSLPVEQRAQGKFFLYTLMNNYDKKPLTFKEQIEHLKQKGITLCDEDNALHTLQHISYFRLKSYLHPIMYDKQTRTYKPNSTFEQGYELYKFDSQLRKLIIAEIEKIEVSIRSQMACISCDKSGTFWFCDKDNFKNINSHSEILDILKLELNRSDDEYVLSFGEKYSNEFPPAWITLEVSSFGTLSRSYKQMHPGLKKRQIAKVYGLSDKVFESWLHSLVYVRNICAHHSRLWNKELRIRPLYPNKTGYTFIENTSKNNRVYYILCIIRYLLQTINPSSTFTQKLTSLLEKFPQINTSAMGFPSNWKDETLWKQTI